jgi:NTE family protein
MGEPMFGVSGNSRRPKTALVLGAGGIKSVCHLGLFRVLQRQNIDVDLIVGSSGGGLFGASYALGVESAQMEHWVKKLFGELTFADTNIPLRVVASDLQAGEAVMLQEGLLVEAIRASVSMPVFFQPHFLDGRYLVDGALCAPLPLEFAIAEGAEVIISMGFANRPHHRIDSPLRLVSQLMKISGTQLQRATMAYYARNPSIEIIPIELELDSALGMRDVGEIPRLIDLGEEVAQKMLPTIQRTIATFHSPKHRLKRRLRFVARRWLRTSSLDLPRLSADLATDPVLPGTATREQRRLEPDDAPSDAAADARHDPYPA